MGSFTTSKGKSVYYETYGAGRPLVMLNGIMMSCASWGAFIEPLSAQNQLVLVDFLDQGQSDRMNDEAPYDQSAQVEVVRELLDHLSLDKVSVAGVSYGGEVAQQFAIRYPQRLERLMLFNTTARTGPWLGDIGEAWNLAASDPDAYYLTTIPVIYSPGFYRRENAWLNRRREMLRPVLAGGEFTDAMIRLTNSAKHYDISDRIREITAPTLVVSGQQDYLIPIEEQQFICSQIPSSRHIIIPNCGHASMYEQPLLFTTLILGFCNTVKTEYQIG